VGEVKVVRSVSEELDAEAVRVVKTLPRFVPGRLFGKAVSAWYTLPVTFKLQDKLEPAKPKDVEVKAEFPGGEEALNQFLKDHIKYPPKAAKRRIQGRVEVAFWIDKSGKVHDVRVVDSVDKDLEREAVRVCKLLPDFIPATVNGELVEVLFKLPIKFNIPSVKRQYLSTVQIDEI
jgi:TonB family protein